MGERRGMKALEIWCRRVTEGYAGVKVENMTTSWRDGLAFCAMIHHFRPDLIDFPSLEKGDVYNNNELAFRTAERHLGIPALLDAEDMALYEVPDRLSILTYLSQFYQVFASHASSPVKRSPEPAERSLVMGTTVQSTPTKEVGCAVRRREPCKACGLPVFLAQRLLVSGHLYHRTCFRCARCSAQLSLANCYETMDGVHCCETCPDEESLDSAAGEQDTVVQDNDTSVKDNLSSLNHGNDRQLTTAIAAEDSPPALSARPASLVGIRKLMFENFAQKSDGGELTDDDKVNYKTRKGSLDRFKTSDSDKLVNTPTSADVDKDKTSCELSPKKQSDNDISFSDVDGNSVDLIVSKISDVSLRSDDFDDKKGVSIEEGYFDKGRECSLQDISCDNKDCDDIPYIDERVLVTDPQPVKNYDKEDGETISDIIKDNNIKPLQGVASEHSSSLVTNKLEADQKCPDEPKDIDVNLLSSSDKTCCVDDTIESHSDVQGTYVEMKPLTDEDVDEPIYEEISEDNIQSNKEIEISPTKENLDKIETEDLVVDETEIKSPVIFVEDIDKSNELDTTSLKEINLENSKVNDNVEDNIAVFKSSDSEIKSVAEKVMSVVDIDPITTDIPSEIKGIEIHKDDEEVEYPSELNPFGDDDEVQVKSVEVEKSKPASTNPFGSDDEDLEEDVDVPKPAERRKKNSPGPSLNPFGSDDDDEETNLNESNRSSQPVPLPRKLRSPQLSPTPRPRNFHSRTSSFASSVGVPSSPSPRKKKPAPLPPQTPKLRKSRPPPPPPPVPRSASPSLSAMDAISLTSTMSSPEMPEKLVKDASNRQKQTSGEGTYTPHKSMYGQWKRKKGQAPPPPIPQRRAVQPMPIKQLRQELKDIEIKQQGLERQGVTLEKTIRDRFDQESSMTPFVEELILQLFELVNEKNDLFRRQAELMYLRRQHNLEEEHAELEYQIRCLMLCPEQNKTDSDKEREEELIKRLIDVVERRNAIVQCLEMDRLREAEEDRSVNAQLDSFSAAIGFDVDLNKSETETDKKEKKSKKEKKKGKIDIDKDIDESEKQKKKHKKKWFTLQHLPKKL